MVKAKGNERFTNILIWTDEQIYLDRVQIYDRRSMFYCLINFYKSNVILSTSVIMLQQEGFSAIRKMKGNREKDMKTLKIYQRREQT